MNKTSALTQSMLEVQAVGESRRKFAIILLSLISLALIALTVYTLFTASQAIVGQPEAVILPSANPELFAAQRYTRAFSQSVNPELRIAHRYVELAVTAKSVSWAANPELNVANRYVKLHTKAVSPASWVTNPELKVMQRFSEMAAIAKSVSWVRGCQPRIASCQALCRNAHKVGEQRFPIHEPGADGRRAVRCQQSQHHRGGFPRYTPGDHGSPTLHPWEIETLSKTAS